MIINLDREIRQSDSLDDLKPILMVLVKALNTLSDAKGVVKGDMIFKDGKIVLRGNDGNYYRLGVDVSSGSPLVSYTLVGKNPTGE